MLARYVSVSVVLLCLAGPVQAQAEACAGAGCPSPNAIGMGTESLQIFELHQQLALNDQWIGRVQWRAVTGTAPETREHCFASCLQNLTRDLQLCQTTHGGAPYADEDAWTTLGRDNCLNFVRQDHMRCVSPVQIAACPSK